MLENLKTYIEKLIAEYEAAKGENASLRAAVESDKAEIISLKEQIIDLNRQIDSLKLKAAFTESSTKDSGAKEKVEKLIKEIDRCISLMEK